MSTRRRYPIEGASCAICGSSEWTGAWAGAGPPLCVCPTCAVDILPQLIADATAPTVRGAHGWQIAKHVLPRVMAAYWRGVAAARYLAEDTREASEPDA